MFDLEDSRPLDDNLDNLAGLGRLGVRTLLPTYNHANRAGAGCLDTDDTGLTAWGRAIVAALDDVGIVPDGSHCSARTGLDMCETSTGGPVNLTAIPVRKALWEHPPQHQRRPGPRVCRHGWRGHRHHRSWDILGPNTPTLEAMTRHLEYAIELVGVDHVGISSDFSFDYADFVAELTRNPQMFDDSYTRWGWIQWMPRETLLTLGEYLSRRGWTDADPAAVLGGNFLRVAESAWRV